MKNNKNKRFVSKANHKRNLSFEVPVDQLANTAVSLMNSDMYVIISKANHKQNWKIEVPVDQLAKTDVASIIRRATAGQPILGDPNRVFDGEGRTDDVNPASAFSWDLDNVNELMRVYNAKSVEDLQAKLAEQQEKLKALETPPDEPPVEPTK